MSKHAPFYRWFPKDYGADPLVRGMSPMQDLAYRRLLDASWELGPLPGDVSKLAVLAGMDVAEFTESIWAYPLTECWKPRKDKTLINHRLEDERDEFMQRSEKGRAAALLMHEKRRKRQGIKKKRRNGSAPAEQSDRSANAVLDACYPKPKEHSQSQSQKAGNRSLPSVQPQAGKLDLSETTFHVERPVYWDTEKSDLVIQKQWLREKVIEYAVDAGVSITERDYKRITNKLRRQFNDAPERRAVMAKKSDGQPSKDSQFKRMETSVITEFKREIDIKADRKERSDGRPSNKTKSSIDAIRQSVDVIKARDDS